MEERIGEKRNKIPRKRGKMAEITRIIIIIGFLFISLWASSFLTILVISTAIVMMCAKEVLVRITLVFEEWKHLNSRYEDDALLLLWNAFTFSNRFKFAFLLSLSYLHYNFHSLNVPKLMEFGIVPISCAIFAALLIGDLIELDYGPMYEAIKFEKLGGLGYGASMAYSYYHGYLKIVLPNKGTEHQGVRELIQLFESNEGVEFPRKRLIVLMPTSLECPPNLEDRSECTELVKSLQEIKMSRGGVHGRVYKSTVYKINCKGKKTLVVAEYATPLRTLEEMMSNIEYADLYKRLKNEIVVQFYLTLKNILNNDSDCKDCCDLLLYNDKTIDGENKDVGKVILKFLRDCKRR